MRSLVLVLLLASYGLNAQRSGAGLTYTVKPAGIKTAKPPVLILLHGYGSNEADLFSLSAELPPDFTIYSLRAPLSVSDRGYCWFPLSFGADRKIGYDYHAVEKSRLAILSFISEVCRSGRVDSNNVFLMGFSQGAIMAYDLALAAPGKVRGVIALSGRMLPESSAIKTSGSDSGNLRFFIAHGHADEVILYKDGSEAPAILRSKGKQHVTFKDYQLAHTISAGLLRDVRAWLPQQLTKKASGRPVR